MNSKRCFVIGIDGMPKTLLHSLAARRVMPFCAQLLDEGTLASLRAPIPALSATSWATFLTGVNPGRHGIFGFVDLKPLSYEQYFPNLSTLAAPALWQFCDWFGLRTASLNVPSTYPARAMNGVLVSGFVVPDPTQGIFPSRLAGDLGALGYVFDVEIGNPLLDPKGFLQRLHGSLDARARTFCHLITTEPADLTVAVFTETDRLQHFLWSSLMNPAAPLHDEVLQVYRHLDDCIETVVSHTMRTDDLLLVSDHGFASLRCQIYLNAWLRERGYFAMPPEARCFADLDPSTRAFALNSGRIYIHTRARFPHGAVSEADAKTLRTQIRDELLGLVSPLTENADAPTPVCGEILIKEEAYHGPRLAYAPDLLVVPTSGFDFHGSWSHQEVSGETSFTGTHTRENGTFYVRGCHRRLETTIEMEDVAPTILGLLAIRCDGTFDGLDVLSADRA